MFVALLVPVGAFHLWSGGSGAIGRPVIAAVLLLGLPIAWLARRAASSAVPRRRWRCSSPPAWPRRCSCCGRCRASCWSPTGTASRACSNTGRRRGACGRSRRRSGRRRRRSPGASARCGSSRSRAAVLLIARLRRPIAPGAAGLAACAIAGGAIALVSGLVPATLDRWRAPAPAPGARPQIQLLSDFDAQRRPLGVVYDPLRRVPAAAIPPLLTFVGRPRRPRRASAAVPICSTARAGRCPPAATTSSSTAATGMIQGEVGLQVGRFGPPLHTWTIAPAPRWTATRRPARQRQLRRVPRLARVGPGRSGAAADPARDSRPAHAPDRSQRHAESPVRRRRGLLLRRARGARTGRLLDARRQHLPLRGRARARSADGAAPARRRAARWR